MALHLGDGQTLSGLVLDLSKSVAVAEGRVVDRDGKPLQGAQVSLCWKTPGGVSYTNPPDGIAPAKTDGQGRYHLENLPMGPWHLWASIGRAVSDPMPVRLSETPAVAPDLVLPVVQTASGRIRRVQPMDAQQTVQEWIDATLAGDTGGVAAVVVPDSAFTRKSGQISRLLTQIKRFPTWSSEYDQGAHVTTNEIHLGDGQSTQLTFVLTRKSGHWRISDVAAPGRPVAPSIPISDFESQLKAGNVKRLTIQGDEAVGDFVNPWMLPITGAPISKFRVVYPSGILSKNAKNLKWILDNGHGAIVSVVNANRLPPTTTQPARTVTFRISARSDGHARTGRAMVKLMDGGLFRWESDDGSVEIQNAPAGKAMYLDPATKVATISLFVPAAQGTEDFLASNMATPRQPPAGAQMLSPKEIAGRKVIGYRETHTGTIKGSPCRTEITTWRDAKTLRGVEAQTVITWAGHKTEITYSDFVFDVPLADSLFAIKPPAGYAAKQGYPVKVQNIPLQETHAASPATLPATRQTHSGLQLRWVANGPTTVPSEEMANPEGQPAKLRVLDQVLLDGSGIKSAKVIRNGGEWAVAFTLTDAGAARFRRITSYNIGHKLAIVVDGKLVSAPTIQSTMGRNGLISGNFTREQAEHLAAEINLAAATLPATQAAQSGLQLRWVAQGPTTAPTQEVPNPHPGGGMPATLRVLDKVVINESDVASAKVIHDRGQWMVNFTLTDAGTARFERTTSGNIGHMLAFFVDGKLVFVPTVQSTIGRSGEIAGNFTREQAEQIAADINRAATTQPEVMPSPLGSP